MTRLRMWLVRLAAVFRTRHLERELEAELRSHLEMQAEDHVRHGMDDAEAGHAARRSFGGVEQVKERYRELRGLPALETVVQDVRHGVRVLARNPGFTVVAVVSLAIGVGANTATFSFADAVLLRPLPMPHAGEMVTVGSMNVATSAGTSALRTSHPDYVDLRDRSRSYEGLSAWTIRPVQLTARPEAAPEVRAAALVSGNFFRTVDVEPEAGRFFLPDEDRVPGRDAVLVLSHGYWRRTLGGDPQAVGSTVRLNGIVFTVVGVAPEWFTGADEFVRPDVYVPLAMWPALLPDGQPDPLEQRDSRELRLLGRLRDDVPLARAQAEAASIGGALAREYPETNERYETFVRTPVEDRIRTSGLMGPVVAMLLTLAAAVLLTACANVAGLLTSRAPLRADELALRLAIGAGRGRLVRQLLTENALLALAGGLAGVAVGYLGIRLWRQISIQSAMPVELAFRLDQRALVVSLVAALLSVFIFGMTPAIQTVRESLASGLRGTGRGTTARRQWGRRLLVTGQVAMALVLLGVAGFMYAAFLRQLAAGPGFRPDPLVTIALDAGLSRSDLEESRRLYDRLVERVREVPGVEAAGLVSFVPMSTDGAGATPVRPEGYQFPAGIDSLSIATSYVDAAAFETMGIPIERGRAFRDTDRAETTPVAIVNRQLAERVWPGQDPVGRRLRLGSAEAPWTEIVGVVPTGRYFMISETPTPFLYLPYAQHPQSRMTLVARAAGDPAGLADPLRQAVRELDRDLAVVSVRTMNDLYRTGAIGNFLVFMRAIAAMGVMGVTLAFVGLYGLVASGVIRRTREIGIRMAIGATRGAVLRMVLTQGMTLAVIGLAVGLVLMVGVSQMMRAAFPGGGGDQRAFVEWVRVAVAALAVTGLASYLPARRASRIEPSRALRSE